MIDAGIGVDVNAFKSEYLEQVKSVLDEATLTLPETKWFQKGGKKGLHSEHMGYILADLQYMQRAYPNMNGNLGSRIISQRQQ